MKNKLSLLACAAACGLTLSSCVVDPYGMPVAGGVYPAPTYASVNYYDSTPLLGGYGYNSGYGYGYAPVATNFSFFGGRGWGNNWGNNCYTPAYYSGGRSYYSGGRSYSRPVSSSHHYASQVTRPSTFRGSSIFSSPPASPSISSPRTLSRPSIRSAPSPTPSRTFSAPSSSSGRSFSAPSLPRPSGRAERSSPGVASFSGPSSSRSAMSAVSSSSSGRFGGGSPSDMRRSR